MHFDGTNLPTKLAHTVWGSPFGDEIRAGAGTLNFAAGAGDDVFIFGRGTSRVMGGAGNDSFVLTKGAIGASDQIIDFHLDLTNGTEHDTLMLLGCWASRPRRTWISSAPPARPSPTSWWMAATPRPGSWWWWSAARRI